MAGRFYTRDRIFIGYSPDLEDAEPVYAAHDLSDDECQTLVAAVQRLFDDLHRSNGGGPWTIELAPTAQSDPIAFIDVKAKWDAHNRDLDEYRATKGGGWRSEIVWLYDICAERAEVIRGLHAHAIPIVYLQRDCGGGFETFGRVDALTWDEIETLEEVLKEELYQMGMILQVITDADAERCPALFVQAKLGWNTIERELDHDANAERDDAWWVAAEVIDELLSLRSRPRRAGRSDRAPSGDALESGVAAEKVAFNASAVDRPIEEPIAIADECRRVSYRDPDNYWRNVWLYEQRRAGKTNQELLDELDRVATVRGFSPLATENGLRQALDAIANHHGWPVLKGKAGRPRTKSPLTGSDNGDAAGNGES